MPCTSPRQVWYGELLPTGKREIIFNARKSVFDEDAFKIRCGKCLSCKSAYAGSWATRLFLESICHAQSSCITLTYNDENLPEYGNINLDHVTSFIRLLRQWYNRKGVPISIKYFGGAEYGSDKGRPHYHVIVYGYYPEDAYYWRRKKVVRYYRSPTLEKLWKKGNVEFASVTPAACSYVANYCLKKLKGSEGQEYYHENGSPDLITGEWIDKIPETARMSKGIGKSFYDQFRDQIYPADFVVVSGRKRPVPRYFDKLLEKEDPVFYQTIKDRRLVVRDGCDFLSLSELDAIDANVKSRINMFAGRTM